MAYFFIIVFLMQVLDSVAGFGSTSIGIPFLSLALGTETAVAMLPTAGITLCLIIIILNYKKIQIRELLIILAFVIPIMPIGYLLYARLRTAEWVLRLVMGSIVTVVSVREIWRRMIRKNTADPPRWVIYTTFFIGAVVQGMLSMGGALINVFALSRMKSKGEFRVTMVCVWLITGIINMIYRVFVLDIYTPVIWRNILYSVPLVCIAFLVGNRIHRRIPNEKFASAVYVIQLVSGLFSIVSGLTLYS